MQLLHLYMAYIDDVEMTESTETATITVNLSKASGSDVTVNFATSDGTALAGSDYTAISGTDYTAFSINRIYYSSCN